MKEEITSENIMSKIYLIRGVKVMPDRDLAGLYGVQTAQLKRQVRRNIDRFPEDFMFELMKVEYNRFIRCQNGTLEKGKYSKSLPLLSLSREFQCFPVYETAKGP